MPGLLCLLLYLGEQFLPLCAVAFLLTHRAVLNGQPGNGIRQFHEFFPRFRVIADIQLVLAGDLLQSLHFLIQGVCLLDHLLPVLGILPLLSRHAVKGYFQHGIFGAELLIRIGFQIIVVDFLFRPVNGQLIQLVLLPLGSFQSGQCFGVFALGKG